MPSGYAKEKGQVHLSMLNYHQTYPPMQTSILIQQYLTSILNSQRLRYDHESGAVFVLTLGEIYSVTNQMIKK